MPFNLVVRSHPFDKPLDLTFGEFTSSQVNIGRGSKNEVSLPDPRSLISSCHAQINLMDGDYVVRDMSMNGTTLDGETLESGVQYPLKPQSQIGICGYILEFIPLPGLQEHRDSEEDAKTKPIHDIVSDPFEDLIEKLRCLYVQVSDRKYDERVAIIVETIRGDLDSMDPETADRLFSFIEATFPDPVFQKGQALEGVSTAFQVKEKDVSKSESGARGWPLEHLVAPFIQAPGKEFSPADDHECLVRLEQAWALLLQLVVQSIAYRRQFHTEFGAAVTQHFKRMQNPFKWYDTPSQFCGHLFNANHPTQDVLGDLEAMLTDLKIFPEALIAGGRKGSFGLLEELNPDAFYQEDQSIRTWLGGNRKREQISKSLAWDRFVKRYQSLIDDQEHTYHHIVSKLIEEGYLDEYKRQVQP